MVYNCVKNKELNLFTGFRKTFLEITLKGFRMKGKAGENLMQLLERRLDNVVFRSGFGRTREKLDK